LPKEIYQSDPISLPEVKKLLLDRAHEDELSYMQRIALEHAQLVTRISVEDSKYLVDTFIEKYRLSDKGAITLANFMPNTIDEIRQLLGKDAISMETETIEEILNELSNIKLLDDKEKYIDLDKLDNAEEAEEEKEIDESEIPEDLLK
jgi:DNA-directed RNA polymerase subunit F